MFFFFFFQAEDGIRDKLVTGVQTCALPICSGVLTVDGAGRLAFINPTGQKLLDLDGEGLIGMPVLDQLKVRSTELWAAMVAGIRNGRKISRGEGMVTHQEGRIFPI